MATKKTTKSDKPQEETPGVPAVAQTQALSTEKVSRWGAAPQLGKRDLLISKVLAMQPMSKKVVKEGVAAFGELRDSISNECLGSFEVPLEILPFHWNNVWVESLWNDEEDDFVYERTVPITKLNEDLPYEDKENGVELKRVYTINVFVMLPREIAENTGFPRIVSFRVSSLRNGRKLLTQMAQGIAAGRGPAAFTYLLSVHKDSNDKGTFAVMDIAKGRETTEAEQDAAFHWFETLNKQAYKVDESDSVDAAQESVSETVDSKGTTGKF